MTPFFEDFDRNVWRLIWSENCGHNVVRCIARNVDGKGECKLVLDFGPQGYQVYAYDPNGLK
jgi:hypothetical protein